MPYSKTLKKYKQHKSHDIMNSRKPYLIAETAFHHEGDIPFMMQLIEEAGKLRANAIKFHLLLEPESYMIRNHQAFEQINKWLFTREQWSAFIKKAISQELDVVLLCNDIASIDFVCKEHRDIKAIEIHASGLNDYFLLEKAAQFPGTVILGVGGSTIDEIQYAVDFLHTHGKTDLLLMYGFQSFPTDYRDINLSKILKLKELFNLPMGYADHTDPNDPYMINVSNMAAAMGVFILEKHFTTVFGQKRIDHQAAVSRDQFLQIKALLELYYTIYGTGNIGLSEAEKAYGNTGPMKKAIVASKKILKGETLSLENLCFKRTNESSYITQNRFLQLIGLETSCDIAEDEIIDFSKVKYVFKKGSFEEFNVSEKKKK
jgi:N,N'-diacetyllegionaminate synthase